MVSRGEVWLATLDATVGREIQKPRPCLIISPPEIHDFLGVVIVAPLTTGGRGAGYRPALAFDGKQGFVLFDQIRTLDKQRLVKRMGRLADPILARCLSTLREMFEA